MNSKEEFVKSQIIASSREVFKKLGYAKVTMDDIAKASGKGRSTLYYYYKNKRDVFEAFVKEEYNEIIEKAQQKVSKERTINENLFDYNQLKLSFLAKKTAEYKHLLSDLKENEDILTKVFLQIRNADIKLVENCLTWAMEKNEIQQISKTDQEFLALAIITATGSLEKEMFLYDSIKDDMFDRLHWISDLLIKGLQ
ncbi:TetR/AcrR family transcriptional regulator [Fulvivirga sediminis]|uniref:TetR/AcrR family transcriptional regulator n=1 Tax=Fulvivirga sediminis TaxID=2803949 RepID=A0A937FA00_9BACT|nr:TetR/AcrR family transcriptional regulator [Fulvivirga sediminis]MBL3658430.1 TetR/AcrR family transcriptional regulator [Fulvivirga sediminis]